MAVLDSIKDVFSNIFYTNKTFQSRLADWIAGKVTGDEAPPPIPHVEVDTSPIGHTWDYYTQWWDSHTYDITQGFENFMQIFNRVLGWLATHFITIGPVTFSFLQLILSMVILDLMLWFVQEFILGD